MSITDRALFDDLAIDEFDSVLRPKDTDFRHSIIFIGCKQLFCRFDLHIDLLFSRIIPQPRSQRTDRSMLADAIYDPLEC